MRLARHAINSGLYPLFEMEHGKVTRVRKIKPDERVGVDEYLKPQKRFAHLFSRPGGDERIMEMQAVADANIERYGLIA